MRRPGHEPFASPAPSEAPPFVYADVLMLGLGYYQVPGTCLDGSEGAN